jgi:hypothetical protein
MALVKILKKSFKNDEGEPVNYERLAIIGTVGGEVHTLELKLENGDMLAAKMLLASEEKSEISSRKASEGESVDVKVKSREDQLGDDLFTLEES